MGSWWGSGDAVPKVINPRMMRSLGFCAMSGMVDSVFCGLWNCLDIWVIRRRGERLRNITSFQVNDDRWTGGVGRSVLPKAVISEPFTNSPRRQAERQMHPTFYCALPVSRQSLNITPDTAFRSHYFTSDCKVSHDLNYLEMPTEFIDCF